MPPNITPSNASLIRIPENTHAKPRDASVHLLSLENFWILPSRQEVITKGVCYEAKPVPKV